MKHKMKQLLLVSLFAGFTLLTHAQTKNSFIGYWEEAHDNEPDVIQSIGIEANETAIILQSNQISFNSTNKMKGDTLVLFFLNFDMGRGGMNYKGHNPAKGSMIAKLYIDKKKVLHIIYTNKKFIQDMAKFAGSFVYTFKKYED